MFERLKSNDRAPSTTVRFSVKFRDQVAAFAVAHNMSTNALVVAALIEYMTSRGSCSPLNDDPDFEAYLRRGREAVRP